MGHLGTGRLEPRRLRAARIARGRRERVRRLERWRPSSSRSARVARPGSRPECAASFRSRCSATSSKQPSTPSRDVRLVTDDDAATLLAAEFGVEVVRDPGGGQGAAVTEALAGVCRLVPGRQCRPSVRLEGRVVATRPLEPVARRSGRRDDERTLAARTGAVRPAVRCREAPSASPQQDSLQSSIPELEQDVDTLADLGRLTLPVGARTALVLDQLKLRLVPAS